MAALALGIVGLLMQTHVSCSEPPGGECSEEQCRGSSGREVMQDVEEVEIKNTKKIKT